MASRQRSLRTRVGESCTLRDKNIDSDHFHIGRSLSSKKLQYGNIRILSATGKLRQRFDGLMLAGNSRMVRAGSVRMAAFRKAFRHVECPGLAGQRPVPPTGPGPLTPQLYLGLLCHFEGIIHLDAQVADRAFQLRMSK